jgi:hypothetical protein
MLRRKTARTDAHCAGCILNGTLDRLHVTNQPPDNDHFQFAYGLAAVLIEITR